MKGDEGSESENDGAHANGGKNGYGQVQGAEREPFAVGLQCSSSFSDAAHIDYFS